MKQRFIKTLRFKISFLLGISLILLLVFLYFINTLFITKNLTNTVNSKVVFECKSYADKINGIINTLYDNAFAVKHAGELFYNLSKDINIISKNTIEQFLKNQIISNKNVFGTGIWYEKYSFNKVEYFGPYVYRDGDKVVLTYDYSNSEYDYPRQSWYTIAVPEDWNRMNKREKDIYITEPYYDETLDTIFITITSVMYDSTGKIIGTVSTDWTLDFIPTLLDQIYITDNSLTVLLDPVTNQILYLSKSNEKGKSFKEFWWGINDIVPGTLKKLKHNSNNYISYFEKLNTGYLLGFIIPEKEIYNVIDKFKNQNIVIYLIITFSILMLVFIIVSTITKPIKKIAEKLSQIAEAEGDLTQTIEHRSKDELGILSKNFNKHIKSLHGIITNLVEGVVNFVKTSQDLAVSSTETSAATNEISANIHTIEQSTNSLNDSVEKLKIAFEKVNENISSITSSINEQSADITESSSAIEEIIKNVNRVSLDIDERVNSIEELQSTIESGFHEMEETISIVNEISKSANIISDLLTVIDNIASQTNLLAMNAAIEAAHAGDAGKGFSIVADEIRKLSESTETNSKEISNSLEEIIKKIQNAQQKSEITGKTFTIISTEIKEITMSMSKVKNVMTELTHGSGQILIALKSLMEKTEEIKKSTRNVNDVVETNWEKVSKVEHISQEVSRGVSEIIIHVDEINQAIISINNISLLNKENAQKLHSLINKFII